MGNDSLKQKIDKLHHELERIQALNDEFQHELERTKATNEIRNLIDTLQYLHTAHRNSETGELFAKRPDSRISLGPNGSFEGADCFFRAAAIKADYSKVGYAPFHLMCNPVIEVAKDGQTAQAVFVAVGLVARKDPETGKPMALWEWNRYSDDFIKEDGKWKIWHHHLYPLFRWFVNGNWEDQFAEGEPPLKMKPDIPATSLDVGYSPDTELPFIPIPKPYQTYDPNKSY